MEKVYIFGHKKPDTDSVTGAIALSYLKNQMGLNTEPRILSPEINDETSYALKRFNIPVPRYLNDVKIQLKDIKYNKYLYINQDASIYETHQYLEKNEITGIPLVDNNKKFVGYVSLKEISNQLINNEADEIDAKFSDIAKLLNATKYHEFDNQIIGKAMSISAFYRMFINTIKVDENSIVITNNVKEIIDHLFEKKVKLIILLENEELTKEQEEMIDKNKINLIITPYNKFKTCRTIYLSNKVKSIKRKGEIIRFNPKDYLTNFVEINKKAKKTNYPLVNGRGYCEGMLRLIDTDEVTRKKVILVDHNEIDQSVDGISEADIIEIVDHHNIGNIKTKTPISFRNMLVGSVNTIIYHLYAEQGVNIPRAIAGIMLSGIISDTLLLASPTTTTADRDVAKELSSIAGVDIKKYGLELLTSGVSIDGLSPAEIIFKDFKTYIVGDNKIAIAQTYTTSFDDHTKAINEYIEKLNDISETGNYKVVCLFITDIINNNSYIIYNESAKKILEDAFNIDNLIEGYMLENVISRKQQIVPLIMDRVEKM